MASEKKRPKLLYIGLCAIAMFLVNRLFFFTPGFLEKVSSMALYPVLVVQHRFLGPWHTWREEQKTIAQLEALVQKEREHNDELLAENIKLHALTVYADEVRELLAFKEGYQAEQAHLAQIIFKNFSDQSHHFLIDKGEQDGITKDMVAVYAQCLIGRVTEVYPYYSKVLLMSDRQCNVASYCESTKSTGIYEGCNKLQEGALSFVSHLSPVEENDLILSSGEGLIFPQGFGLGRIKTYQTNGLYQEISVEPLLDVTRLQYCMIIQKGMVSRNEESV